MILNNLISPNHSQPSSNQPIFIVGCGHSGTTLMLRLLGIHRHLFAIPIETYMFVRPEAVSFCLPSPHTIAEVAINICGSEIDLKQIRDRQQMINYLATLMTAASKKLRWIEKTPRHIHCINEILAFFPAARVIIMLRDGRNVAVSLRDRYATPDAFELAAHRWVSDNEAGEGFWVRPNVKLVRLEELISDVGSTMRSIAAFLGEDFDERVLTYNHPLRKSQDPPSSGIGRANWVIYRKWLAGQPILDTRLKWVGLMSEDEKQIFKTIAGSMLIRYNYAADSNW